MDTKEGGEGNIRKGKMRNRGGSEKKNRISGKEDERERGGCRENISVMTNKKSVKSEERA